MSEARALTNLIGNAVATVVLARWEGEFDDAKAARILRSPDPALAASELELANPPAATPW